MKIEAYNYVFHPCHENHHPVVKVLAVITTIALSILTCGLFLALFAYIRGQEGEAGAKVGEIVRTIPALSSKLQEIKYKSLESFKRMQKDAANGNWDELSYHKTYGFDWWMFPVDWDSRSYGNRYTVNNDDVALLKGDQEFMERYRKAVLLVATSWGWNLETEKDEPGPKKGWQGHHDRLGKILYSLKLFGETKLHRKLANFVNNEKLIVVGRLPDWVQQAISA